MSDITHAGLMDGVYRHQRHIYDLTRKYYLLGRDHLIENLSPPSHGSVLEVGCGTGRNLISAARKYPAVKFYGIDISEQMLDTARANIARACLADRIFVAQADATNFCSGNILGKSGFDRIFVSYALSMIPDWQGTIEHSFQHLEPNGSLHIVDFGDLEKLPKVFKSLLYGWLTRFHVTPRNRLTPVLQEIATTHKSKLEIEKLYRHYALHATIVRR